MINGGHRYITEDGGNSFIEITGDVPTGFDSFGAITDELGFAVGIGGLILRYDDTTYVPVELISFNAEVINNEIVLSWMTGSEINNLGFSIEKSFDRINWETRGFINGKGTSTEINYYRFVDNSLSNVRIFYRLKQLDYDGSYSYSQIIEIEIPVNNFTLSQNFPNPANPTTTIKYDIPKSGNVDLVLYDILGRKVKNLVNENQQAGRYEISFNASGLASGVYFYQLKTEHFVNTKKMILLR
jgi:hypothetical protein